VLSKAKFSVRIKITAGSNIWNGNMDDGKERRASFAYFLKENI
jgi:hypothetical protein